MRLSQIVASLLVLGVIAQIQQQQNIATNVGSLNTPLTFTATSNGAVSNIGAPLSFVTQQPVVQTSQQQVINSQVTQQVQQQIAPQTILPIGALPLGQYSTNGNNVGLATAQTPLTFGSQQQITGTSVSPPIGAIPLGRYLDNGLNLDDNTIYGYKFQTGCEARNSYSRNQKNSDNSRQCPRFKSDDDKNGYSSLEEYFYSVSKNGKDSSHQDASFFFPAGLIPTNSPISLITEGFFVNRSSSCPINEYLNGNTCNCIPGFERSSGARNCKLSKHYQVPQSQTIKILEAPSKSQCVSDYSYVTSDGYCTCQLGYVFNTKYVCFPVPKGLTCPQGSILYPDNTCSCPKNFFLNSGVCRSCPPYHYWSGSNCISNCPANSVYDAVKRNCTCNAGYITTAPDVCSPCAKGFTSYNNLCVKCPINSQLIGGQCTCLPGSRNVGGNCVSICPPQAYFDEILKKCMCLQTNCYVNQNNVCTSCSAGTYFNGHSCITCSAESYFDPVTRTCRICVRPSVVVNSVCVTCPVGTAFAPLLNQCVCAISPGAPVPIYCQSFSISSGFFQTITTNTTTIACIGNTQLVGGICLSCQANSTSINGICQCNNGFSNNTSIHPNGVCTIVCPTGMYNTKGQCIMCPVSSIWSDVEQKCICQSGYATSPLYPGKCVSISLLQFNQTTVITNTTSTISGYCPTGCPLGYRCNSNNQCIQDGSITGGLTYQQQQLLLQQQQQYQYYLQQQQQQQQQQTIVHQTNSVSLSSASIAVANVFSGINNATFTARVSPVPRSMVFNFPNLQPNLFPSGTCRQTADLNIWNCVIDYKNQPISIAYSVILTASSDIGNWSTQFTVNPIRSNL